MGRLKITGRTGSVGLCRRLWSSCSTYYCPAGKGCQETSESGDKDTIEKEFKELLARVNRGLDEHEKVQFIAIMNEEWLPENGFVTPTNN